MQCLYEQYTSIYYRIRIGHTVHYRTIAPSSSCHRAIALQYHRVIVIAPSRHRFIELNTMVRWCDSELRGPILHDSIIYCKEHLNARCNLDFSP